MQPKALVLNNKNKTYLLLLVVLAVWGTIAYKITNGINTELPSASQATVATTFKPEKQALLESFAIKNTTRDPFLGTLHSPKKSASRSQPKTTKAVKESLFPLVNYSGLIKKQNTKAPIFVVTINTKQYLLKKGQMADSVTLIKGTAKEIVVRYNKRSKTINRH